MPRQVLDFWSPRVALNATRVLLLKGSRQPAQVAHVTVPAQTLPEQP